MLLIQHYDDLQDKAKASNRTLQVTGAVGWRSEGIKHKKNEVFLDIIEQVNLLVSNKGVQNHAMPVLPSQNPVVDSTSSDKILDSVPTILNVDNPYWA